MVNVELRLLTAMCFSGDFSPVITGEITKDHFATDQGQAIFIFISNYKAMTDGAGRFPSLIVVRTRFPAAELPDPDPADVVKALAHEVIVEKLRSDVRVLSQDLEIISRQVDPLPDLQSSVGRLKKMSESVTRTRHISLDTSIQGVLADYDDGNILPDGIPWPWPSMTEGTRGLHRKETIVLAGRPKSRKTFLAIHVGVHAVKCYHQRVLMFTPEMPPKQIMLRVIADMAGVRYREFKNAKLEDMEVSKLVEIATRYGRIENEDDENYGFRLAGNLELPSGARPPRFDIVQSTGKSVSWMESQVEMYDPDLVIADSFYKQIPDGGRKNDTDWKQMSSVSRAIKDLTMEANIMMLATHSMNRGAEERVGSLANLGLADAVGQDADLVLRAVTGKKEDQDQTALVVLGGREVPFEGVLINNKPSFDFSEICILTNKEQITGLMKRDDQVDEEESGKGRKKKPKDRTTHSSATTGMGEASDMADDPDTDLRT